MPPDRYPVYNVNCGAFSLKKGNLCFQPEDEKPLLQLRFDQDGTRECFFFHEARVRQFDPEGGLGITPKTVTFAKLSSTPTGSKYEETSLEESHHPVASTLTEPQLEGIEWTLTLRSPLPIYRIKRVGDQCTNWTTTTLREYNYDLSDLPPDPEVIDYDTENFDSENHPQTRLFKIVEVEGKDPGVDSGIVKWVVMFEHQGSFNIPEVPTPRRLWTIPKRYLENRNFEQKEKERLEEMEKKQNERSQEYTSPWGLDTENKEKKKQQQQQQRENKEVEETKKMKEAQDEGFPAEDPSSWDQQKSSQNPQGSWGDEPEELEKPAAPTVIRKTKAEEMADLWRGFRQNTKPQVPQVPQVKKQEEPEEVKQTETKKKRKKKKKKSQGTQEDQGSEESEGGDEGQGRQAKEGKEAGKEPKQVEEKEEKKEKKQEESIEERLAKVPLGERWWEPTPAEIEAKKKEEEQRKPGWWGEELWLKRQKEKEEENRKRVEAGGEDRWWDYEERPNPTGWW
ncbi:hypothetical protein TWF102_011023 [Orbilia oligospora]|uniref:Uncharacterized protein n=1 Tax=Orbilia oligospora TaxID=2813651 RepID=A0A7C8NZW6_ORBOL|nr:hypothetical protein TWF103_001799 [Orbilia oligospora]KAF3086418.1 hypothetical protein TWF102_011023 [Orbilia oligospora]KAF3086647.1 hypothetical protein TWF706_011390 [Orbilia oligospora]KAF3122491.1 hypothetical protein TWF703_001391 [Orbilia oligospora]